MVAYKMVAFNNVLMVLGKVQLGTAPAMVKGLFLEKRIFCFKCDPDKAKIISKIIIVPKLLPNYCDGRYDGNFENLAQLNLRMKNS